MRILDLYKRPNIFSKSKCRLNFSIPLPKIEAMDCSEIIEKAKASFVNQDIENFKSKVMATTLEGKSIAEWGQIFKGKRGEEALHKALGKNLGIK